MLITRSLLLINCNLKSTRKWINCNLRKITWCDEGKIIFFAINKKQYWFYGYVIVLLTSSYYQIRYKGKSTIISFRHGKNQVYKIGFGIFNTHVEYFNFNIYQLCDIILSLQKYTFHYSKTLLSLQLFLIMWTE